MNTRFSGSDLPVLVKLGGSLLDDIERRTAALTRIVARWNAGENIILVHGGGKNIDAALKAAGIARRTHAGLRITDDATLAIVVSVLGGQVNKMLVSELTKLGARAAGISGCDGATLTAEQHPPIDGVALGHVGRVTGSNRALVGAMLTYGTLPVISSIAIGDQGQLFNVNADSAASAIAVAHSVRELLFLTDVEGLLDANGALVPALDSAGLEAMLETPAVSGGMKPKLQAALAALRAGVPQITITAPASEPSPVPASGGTTLVAA